MTDKVQKIREKVERMHNLLPVMDGDNISVNYADRICTTLEMYIDFLQEEPSKFDAAIQEGDDVRYNEDLGCRVNLSQLKRVAKKEEPVSEDLEKAAEQDVCEVVNTCSAIGIPNDHIPSWVQDAMVNEFIHGAKWLFERVNEALLSEVLPCFMHGGEADEVVAKLEEVLNKKINSYE